MLFSEGSQGSYSARSCRHTWCKAGAGRCQQWPCLFVGKQAFGAGIDWRRSFITTAINPCAQPNPAAISAPGRGSRAGTSAPGRGSPLPHLHRDWAHPCHICTGTGLTPATSAPGLGALQAKLQQTEADRSDRLSHLRASNKPTDRGGTDRPTDWTGLSGRKWLFRHRPIGAVFSRIGLPPAAQHGARLHRSPGSSRGHQGRAGLC
jgi:hypothetical protein